LTEIGAVPFRDGDGLKDVTLQKGIQKIEHKAFTDCRSISKINLLASLASFAESVFPPPAALASLGRMEVTASRLLNRGNSEIHLIGCLPYTSRTLLGEGQKF
jgi:hypothetical protein